MPVKINHFDRGKPFYPYIINYISTLHGIIELISRSIIKKIEHLNGIEIENFFREVDLRPDIKENFKKNRTTTPLIPLSLKSFFQQDRIEINIEEIANDWFNNGHYLVSYQMKAAGVLFIVAYETTKKYNDNSPIWNFFYHCRNAAAHNGKFTFTKWGLKKLPAKWGQFEITKSSEGTNLFRIPNSGGLLGIGDPIRLLWDIEQQYPQMRVEPS